MEIETITIKCLLVWSVFMVSTAAMTQSLEQQVISKIEILNNLIEVAEQEGIDAHKEKMTARTAEIFLGYATWDENNLEENVSYFELVPIYSDSAMQMAINLPDFERQECIIMLDEAINYLSRLKNKEIFRKNIPQVNWAEVTNDNERLIFEDRPVFLADYTWKPGIPFLQEYHGQQDGFYISPVHVNDSDGTIKSSIINDLKSKPSGNAGFIFINNKNVPNWTETKYGENFKMREYTFTAYDIDHPGAKEMMGYLLDGTVPHMAGKKYTELGYMLCNEPHFFTKEDVWATGQVSEYTIEKFKTWLKGKHGSIDKLNTLWNTSFNGFNDIIISIPINGDLQGTPIWYDWVYFNMYRVTEWYQFVKSRIVQSDPNGKVHIKIMPRLWTDNWKDHGIDLEALTHMSDIIGNDAGAWNNHMWGPREDWEDDYSFAWREMTMGNDFMKSVSPEKIIFNSEAHYLSKGISRNLYEDPPYTRATYWLAHTMGMNASQTWFWARREDGSIRNNAGKGYAGSNNQQPRIVNELHSTLMDLNAHSEEITKMQQQVRPLRIFYSKTSAINKKDHMDDVFELYKSLSFEGVSLGFATKDIINQHDNKNWEVILVYDTEFVTKDEFDALQAYLNNGGTVVKDAISLTKNEYGSELEELKQSNGTLTILNGTSEMKEVALSILEDQTLLPEITLIESNGTKTKGCQWKCIKNEAGNNVLSIVNMGNTEATITINLKSANTTYCKDLLKGVDIPSTLTLSPFEVRFLEVNNNASVSIHHPKTSLLPFNIYPNPSTGWFQIKLNKNHKNIDIKVYDNTGNLVLSRKYINTQYIEDNISNHPSGSYILQVNVDKKVYRQVIIKN